LTQRLNGRLEGQALRLEKACRHRAPVANQGGQHDGTVDAAAAALLGRERGIAKHLRQRL
jgi:hypothetical protein